MDGILRDTSLRGQDPYLGEEKLKYGHPIPSRKWILDILTRRAVPVSYNDLSADLAIASHEEDAFNNRLRAMVRDGQIYINRRKMLCVADKLELVKCRVEGHKDGFGFAVPVEAGAGADFMLSDKKMTYLMHGDLVSIRPAGFNHRGRREGRVVEILERKYRELVVRLYREQDVLIGVPEDKRLTQKIVVRNPHNTDIVQGVVAVVAIDTYPDKIALTMGHIKEILGTYADPGMEIEIALRKHELPHQFTAATVREAAAVNSSIAESELQNRRDLRRLPLVTIDGESARDFDDAVYAEPKGQNYRLIVAIADVSYYVRPGTALDQDAYERGTSVYFPRRVIPMLPAVLSDGLCSLLPHEDRLTMVADLEITPAGEIKAYEFYPAVINSHARLTYNEVAAALTADKHHAYQEQLDNLYKVFQALNKERQLRGAIEFDSLQTQMLFDDNNKIKAIIPETRNIAHRLIEECMLATNVSAAAFILSSKVPSLFRIHEGPTPEKLQVLREQLSFLGLTLIREGKPEPQDYSRLLTKLAARPDKELIETMLLRSMQQAVYQPENLGHFGLAYPAYLHFTSPIRRYPDLTVHRALKGILTGQTYTPAISWQEMGVHCSYTERRAEEASRDVEKWLKTYYMKDKLGEIFPGTVSGLTNFGLFIMLRDIFVEGMVHISDLGQDYFNYRPEQLAIIGERTKKRFTLGDEVVVKVAQADLDTCRVDLVLVSGGDSSNLNGKKPEAAAAVKKKGNNRAARRRSHERKNKNTAGARQQTAKNNS